MGPNEFNEAFGKKPIESVSMLIPRGGGEGGGVHKPALTQPYVFACSKPTCLALGGPKEGLSMLTDSLFFF